MGAKIFHGSKEDGWLVAFLSTNFYEPCTYQDCYKGGASTIYCTVCMGNPFCVNCKGQHENNFKDHNLLEICALPYLFSIWFSFLTSIIPSRTTVSVPPNSIFSGCRLSRQVIMLQSSIETLRKSCRLRESESTSSIQTRSFFFDVGKPRRIRVQGKKDTAKDVAGLWTIKLLVKSPHLQVELAECNNPSTFVSSAKSTVPVKLLHRGSEPLELEPACPSKEVAEPSEIEALHKKNVLNYRNRSRKRTPCRSPLF